MKAKSLNSTFFGKIAAKAARVIFNSPQPQPIQTKTTTEKKHNKKTLSVT